MKKPIVGKADAFADNDSVTWDLGPSNIQLYKNGSMEADAIEIYMDDRFVSKVDKKTAAALFEVILYPPGSVPSPESAEPTDKAVMRLEAERQWDIPRKDLENGDWN